MPTMCINSYVCELKGRETEYRNRNMSRAQRNLHICLPCRWEQRDFSYRCEIDAESYISKIYCAMKENVFFF